MLDMTGLEPGCYIAGSEGRFAIIEMVSMAEAFGFPVTPVEQLVMNMYRDDKETITVNYKDGKHAKISVLEWTVEIADKAERWLNDNTPDDYVWHWEDGEFFFQHRSQIEDF